MESTTELPQKKAAFQFDWTFNLGHVFIILSFVSTMVLGFTQYRVQSANLDQLLNYKLPDRVAVLETHDHDQKELNTQLHEDIRALTQAILEQDRQKK